MKRQQPLVRLFFLLFCSLLQADSAWALDLRLARESFLAAEQALKRGDEAGYSKLAETLQDYPLYPYLQYRWLKEHLNQDEKIQAFLFTYGDTRYAPLLRGKWLKEMAGGQRWTDFIANFRPGNAVGLECLFHWAQYQNGLREPAMANAKRLWSQGGSHPKECRELFSALTSTGALSTETIWQRFELALSERRRDLAGNIAQLLVGGEKATAELWLRVDKRPGNVESDRQRFRLSPRTGRIFAYGVEHWAKTHLLNAVQLWDAEKTRLPVEDRIKQAVERTLALAFAYQRKSGAYDRLTRLPFSDGEIREWRVRSALMEQNWQHVYAATSAMTIEELKDARWRYWLARACENLGKKAEARTSYALAAADRSYYGFLAADVLAQPYSLPDRPVPVAFDALVALANKPDFQSVNELRVLHREDEAERQWWYAVANLSHEQQALAAKLAESWAWNKVAIRTLVKADYWDDLALRFPLSYREKVHNQAIRYQIQPAVVLGLIRQESMLDHRAESPVGARGLMQLMPRTGQQMAKEMRERLTHADGLFNPDLNIRLGTYFLQKLIRRFNGGVALAAAAYNAGPARVDQWRPISGTMPADVWIETIPFKETRKYVAAVLAYAVVYQYRLRRNDFRISDLMGSISAS